MIYVKRKTLFILAVILALFVALVLTYVRFGMDKNFDITEIPELFVKAAQGLNQSNLVLENTVNGNSVEYGNLAEEMRSLSEKLRYIYEKADLGEGELANRLKTASKSYSDVAYGAYKMLELSEEFRELKGSIDEMFKMLSYCNIAGAKNKASELDSKLEKLKEEAKNLMLLLSNIDENSLLSDNHRKILEHSIDVSTKFYLMLSELTKVKDILIQTDEKVLENACAAYKCGCAPKNMEGMDKLALGLSKLSPKDGWGYSYEIGEFKTWLKYLGQQGLSNGMGGDNTGSGAGEGYPSSDD